MSRSARWALGAGAGSLGAFIVFVILLWRAGLFDFTGTDSSSKVVGASVALVGGFIGSVVAFVGLVLTHAIQLRAEKRQQVEAVIGALGLLTAPSGGEVSLAQRAGVLFALDSLEMPQLALTMLDHMLGTGTIDLTAAEQIIDRGLCSKDEATNIESANILYEHAPKFATSPGYAFPPCVDMVWSVKKPELVREMVALARLRLIRSRPRSEWRDGDLFAHTAALATIWRLERSERIRKDVGIFLHGLLAIYGPKATLYPPDGPLDVDQLRRELESSDLSRSRPTALARPLVDAMDEWLKT